MNFNSRDIIGRNGWLISERRYKKLSNKSDYITLKEEFTKKLSYYSEHDMYNLREQLNKNASEKKVVGNILNIVFGALIAAVIGVIVNLPIFNNSNNVPIIVFVIAFIVFEVIIIFALALALSPIFIATFSNTAKEQCSRFYLRIYNEYISEKLNKGQNLIKHARNPIFCLFRTTENDWLPCASYRRKKFGHKTRNPKKHMRKNEIRSQTRILPCKTKISISQW